MQSVLETAEWLFHPMSRESESGSVHIVSRFFSSPQEQGPILLC